MKHYKITDAGTGSKEIRFMDGTPLLILTKGNLPKGEESLEKLAEKVAIVYMRGCREGMRDGFQSAINTLNDGYNARYGE